MALLKEFQESPTSQESRPQRRIVYPFFIRRDNDTKRVVVHFPAFPHWEIRDGDETSAIARARGFITDLVHALERAQLSLPRPNDGGLPQEFDERRTISIVLADHSK